jgi:hypothetical protein
MMKKIAFAAVAVIAASASLSTAAKAEYCDDGYSYYHTSYRHDDYERDYCYVKTVVYYDDYGYRHYKRVRVCD